MPLCIQYLQKRKEKREHPLAIYFFFKRHKRLHFIFQLAKHIGGFQKNVQECCLTRQGKTPRECCIHTSNTNIKNNHSCNLKMNQL